MTGCLMKCVTYIRLAMATVRPYLHHRVVVVVIQYVTVCVCGHHCQQSGYQSDMVANPARVVN